MLRPGDAAFVDHESLRGKIDHSSAGAQWLWETCGDEVKLGKLATELISIGIFSHHGGLLDVIDPSGEDRLFSRLNKDSSLTHYHEIRGKVNAIIVSRVEELAACIRKTAPLNHVIRRTHEYADDSGRAFARGLLARFLFSCLVDADRISTADFENPEAAKLRYLGNYPDWSKLIECFDAVSFEVTNDVDQVRKEISDACFTKSTERQGLHYLTVPTGGGKTFSSLRFALHHAKQHGLDRIIYVIPYTSIIDQNAAKIRDVFTSIQQDIVLEHHSNLIPEKDTWRNRVLSENWDAPIVFTTSVQLLETLFGGGTRSARRMHQLAKSVIIFDEIQTLPIRTVHLFNNAVNFLTQVCSSTVVFCTATQPLLHGVDPVKGAVPYAESMEIVDYPPLFKALKRVEVNDHCKPGGWTYDEVAAEVQALLKRKGSVLAVVNTKSDAKRLHEACKTLPAKVVHLSTSMCPTHRKAVLNDVNICLCSEKPEPVVCISTQLIEAGVDVDFGAVIRCLAGLDSIAQAAGRCNRNDRQKPERGIVQIVNLQNENLDKLPEIKVAQNITRRVLDEFKKDPSGFDKDVIGYKAMKRFYQYFFYERAHEMSYPVGKKTIGRDDDLLSLLSENRASVEAFKQQSNSSPRFYLRQSFKTAGDYFEVIDAPTEAILVQYNAEAKDIITKLSPDLPLKETVRLLKRAQQYSVNVFPYMMEKLHKEKALHEVYPGSGIWFLDVQYYSMDFGVSDEPVNPMELLLVEGG